MEQPRVFQHHAAAGPRSKSPADILIHQPLGRAKVGSVAATHPPGQFDFPATLRGSTSHFHIYYDPALGQPGIAIADGVKATCEADYEKISAIFGGLSAGPFNVILASNPGGAYHYGCGGTDLYCDTRLAPQDSTFSEFLNVAEFVEVFSAVQNKGWDCGKANGEGLSRALATTLYPNELGQFATGPAWLDSRGRPNFVDRNGTSDTNPLANGCAVLFLNYLAHQLKFSWTQIVAAAAPTLGQTYTALTNKKGGFKQFSALLLSHYPRGKPSGVTTDNPFPL
jgi:hypothetical protein